MKRLLFRGSQVFEVHLWPDDMIKSAGVGGFCATEEAEDESELRAGPGPEPISTHFLEIELRDEEDQPIPNEQYRVTFANGTVREGRLDENGLADFRNLQSGGECQVSFPALDQEAWERA
jgi:hypothetical protein